MPVPGGQAYLDLDSNGQLSDDEKDADADGIKDTVDNCVSKANTDQLDSDADGAGDACDAFPTNLAESKDADRKSVV